MADAARKIQACYRGHRQRFKNKLYKYQKELKEFVENLSMCQTRLRVTRGERIDSETALFTSEGAEAKQHRSKLIETSKDAHIQINALMAKKPSESVYTQTATQAFKALTDELMVAVMNDLMLSAPTEAIFGIQTTDHTMTVESTSSNIPDELIGLLVYRAWQLLLRKQSGRTILIASSSLENKEILKPDKYEDILAVIMHEAMSKTLPDYFKSCVLRMTATENPHNGLTCIEKGCLLNNIDTFNWHEWYFTC